MSTPNAFAHFGNSSCAFQSPTRSIRTIAAWRNTSSAVFRVGKCFVTSFGGSLADAFVTKFNAAGNQVIYSTFLGGNGNDGVTSIAIDPTGNAYVTGVTFSTNFPTASAYDASPNGGRDVFVSKFNTSGNSLLYSTYLGGSSDDEAQDIAFDGSNIYVAGLTKSMVRRTSSRV